MITKLPEARNNHLVVIQFLDEKEPPTGKSLAAIIAQYCPYIEHVHYFSFSNGETLKEFLLSKMADYFEDKSNVIIYIDSHGTEKGSGIATKQNAFVDWKCLINSLKIACSKLIKRPTLILTACNGIGIKDFIDQLDEPMVSKLIAGNGIMLNGPVLGAFRKILEEKGIDLNKEDVKKVNDIIKLRFPDHPEFDYIEY
ncbi:MAG: hypothetical protein K2J63_12865 [Muribaculaceae bacterium]|nr:hypothetical protein [Muribaculaceae bacterium]